MTRLKKAWPVIACLVMCVPISACNDDAEEEIRRVLAAQTDAWNRGDIDAFMEGYWKSPELLFAGRGTFARGWQSLRDRYGENYSKDQMGTLEFSELEFHIISRTTAWVAGKWQLTRTNDTPHGVFSLILEKKPEGWRIVHDHSSGVESSE